MAHQHAKYEFDAFVGVKSLKSTPKLTLLNEPAIHDVAENADQKVNLCYDNEHKPALAIDDNRLQQALHQY